MKKYEISIYMRGLLIWIGLAKISTSEPALNPNYWNHLNCNLLGCFSTSPRKFELAYLIVTSPNSHSLWMGSNQVDPVISEICLVSRSCKGQELTTNVVAVVVVIIIIILK